MDTIRAPGFAYAFFTVTTSGNPDTADVVHIIAPNSVLGVTGGKPDRGCHLGSSIDDIVCHYDVMI